MHLKHAVLLRCLRQQERKASVVGCAPSAAPIHCNLHEGAEIFRSGISRGRRVPFLSSAELQGLEVQERARCRC